MKPDIGLVFERKYDEWKSYCETDYVAESSSDTRYIDNEPFRDIVALGKEAMPHIIAKMKLDPDAHFLIHAMEQITQKHFSPEEIETGKKEYGSPLGNQGYAKMWIDWWEKKQG